MEKLTPEEQAIVRQAAVEAAQAARANNDARASEMEADLSSKGMTIVASDEVDSSAFRAAAQPCYDEMKSYIGGNWFDRLMPLVQ